MGRDAEDKMTDEEKVNKDKADASTSNDPVRKVSKYVLYTVLFIFTWYVIADRVAPWTDQARVQAYVVPIVSQVPGRVTEINVDKDQLVQPGDILFKIDTADYELAVENAESALELAGQKIGAGMANVTTAQAGVVAAETNLEHMKVQSVRVYELEKQHVLSESDGDKARAKVKSAEAQLMSARAQLDKAKQALGEKGNKNPRIRSAIAALKKAQLDLSRTTVIAPSRGGITNLKIDVGHYANVGSALMTFIEIDNIWIEANLRENNIANIKQGNAVDITLDVAPGKIFTGTVSSIGFAVESGSSSQVGGLASVKGKSGWLRDAQRFPVIIKFDDESSRGYQRLGGQADVLVYTGDNSLVNALGWLWIRVLSWFSFVY